MNGVNILHIYKMSHKERAELKERLNRQVDIMTFAQELGYTLTKKGHTYSLAEHDSVIFFPKTNTFFRYSAGVGGGAVDFLNFVYGHDHPEQNLNYLKCLQIISERDEVKNDKKTSPNTYEKKDQEKEYSDSLPDQIKRHRLLLKYLINHKDDGIKSVYAYLIKTRHISPDIVRRYVNDGLVVQGQYNNSAKAKTCMFLGKNEYGLLCGINERGMHPEIKFQKSVPESNFRRGWLYDSKIDYDKLQRYTLYEGGKPSDFVNMKGRTLLCAESNIEIMSIMSVLNEAGEDINRFAYLSCASISNYKSILETCKMYGYDDVVVMFNNDWKAEKEKHHNWGKEAAQRVINKLGEMGIDAREVYPPRQYNDWNDLCKSIDDFHKLSCEAAQEMVSRDDSSPQKESRANNLDGIGGMVERARKKKDEIRKEDNKRVSEKYFER